MYYCWLSGSVVALFTQLAHRFLIGSKDPDGSSSSSDLLEVVPPMIWIYQAVHFMSVVSIYTKNSDLRYNTKVERYFWIFLRSFLKRKLSNSLGSLSVGGNKRTQERQTTQKIESIPRITNREREASIFISRTRYNGTQQEEIESLQNSSQGNAETNMSTVVDIHDEPRSSQHRLATRTGLGMPFNSNMTEVHI